MRKATAEELEREYREDAIADLDALSRMIAETCESPIEKLLMWQIVSHSNGSGHSASVVDCAGCFPGASDTEAFAVICPRAEGDEYPETYEFWLQPKVHFDSWSYRLDIGFIYRLGRGAPVFIAVECDGHDFHEKTKAQAQRDKKRDRDLQSIGWNVARFTGSEIFNTPHESASSLFAMARSLYDTRNGRG